eukprot:m.317417 g.317417  ORF g.317417 m.317417 type:complete len:123 (+) comp20284_c0_seq75:2881-3249(+)
MQKTGAAIDPSMYFVVHRDIRVILLCMLSQWLHGRSRELCMTTSRVRFADGTMRSFNADFPANVRVHVQDNARGRDDGRASVRVRKTVAQIVHDRLQRGSLRQPLQRQCTAQCGEQINGKCT